MGLNQQVNPESEISALTKEFQLPFDKKFKITVTAMENKEFDNDVINYFKNLELSDIIDDGFNLSNFMNFELGFLSGELVSLEFTLCSNDENEGKSLSFELGNADVYTEVDLNKLTDFNIDAKLESTVLTIGVKEWNQIPFTNIILGVEAKGKIGSFGASEVYEFELGVFWDTTN